MHTRDKTVHYNKTGKDINILQYKLLHACICAYKYYVIIWTGWKIYEKLKYYIDHMSLLLLLPIKTKIPKK